MANEVHFHAALPSQVAIFEPPSRQIRWPKTNGSGQFHRSAYTEAKLRALASTLEFHSIAVRRLFNKGGQALRARLER